MRCGTLARILVVMLAVGILSTGCRAPDTVHIRPSAIPAPNVSLPPLNKKRIEQALVPGEAGLLETEAERRFAAAREAFWNRSTDEAVSILRDLIRAGSPKSDTNHAAFLIAEVYQEDGRWKEAADQWAAINSKGRFQYRLDFARFMAGLPPRTIAFQSNVAPTQIELKLGQLVKARARINGVEATVFVDTGFSMTFVSDKFARRAGVVVHSQKIGFNDANNRGGQVSIALVRDLEFGALRAENVPVISGSLGYLDNIAGEVDAVIGWDLLQHADVTWDFPALRMEVSQPSGTRMVDPKLSGRKAPLLQVASMDGRPLDLFLDTGFASKPPSLSLVANAGLLFTKIDERHASRTLRPTISVGMRSFRVKWPRRIRPFKFWFDGNSFTVPTATVSRRIDVREGVQTCDGMIGNGPFLSGRLRVCGVRRLAEFTPGPAMPETGGR